MEQEYESLVQTEKLISEKESEDPKKKKVENSEESIEKKL